MEEKGFEDIVDEEVVKFAQRFWKKPWKMSWKMSWKLFVVGLFLLYVVWVIIDILICDCYYDRARWSNGKDVPKIIESYCQWSNPFY